MQARQQTPTELAQVLERSLQFVEELLAGCEVLDEDIAQRLEDFWGIAAGFWRRKEERFRQDLAKYEVYREEQKQRQA